jgi:hypothetical protein
VSHDVLGEIMSKRRDAAVKLARDAVAKMRLDGEPLSAKRQLVLELARAVDPAAFGLDRSPLAGPNAGKKKGGAR